MIYKGRIIIYNVYKIIIILCPKGINMERNYFKRHRGASLAIQWVRTLYFPGAQVRSLVRKLRSGKQCSQKKKKAL